MNTMQPERVDGASLDNFPEDLIAKLLSRLGTGNDVAKCAAVSRKWRSASRLVERLSFSKGLFPGEMSQSHMEMIVTKTLLKTKKLRSLDVAFDGEDLVSVAAVLSWVLFTRPSLRELKFSRLGPDDECWEDESAASSDNGDEDLDDGGEINGSDDDMGDEPEPEFDEELDPYGDTAEATDNEDCENDDEERLMLSQLLEECLAGQLEQLQLEHMPIFLAKGRPRMSPANCLRSLQLSFVKVGSEALRSLVAACPQLENLILNHVKTSEVKVAAPRLKELRMVTKVSHKLVKVQHAAALSVLVLSGTGSADALEIRGASSLVQADLTCGLPWTGIQEAIAGARELRSLSFKLGAHDETALVDIDQLVARHSKLQKLHIIHPRLKSSGERPSRSASWSELSDLSLTFAAAAGGSFESVSALTHRANGLRHLSIALCTSGDDLWREARRSTWSKNCSLLASSALELQRQMPELEIKAHFCFYGDSCEPCCRTC